MKSHPNYPGYYITEDGELYSERLGKLKKRNVNPDKRGYVKTLLYTVDNKPVCKSIHQLVADLFVENPNNYLEIRHINGNRSDNRASNLEWYNHGKSKLINQATWLVENTTTSETFVVKSLPDFCKEKGLSLDAMRKTNPNTKNGYIRIHRGFRILQKYEK